MELIAEDGLRAVLQVTAALHQSGTPVRFYEASVEAVVTTVGADRAALLLYDPDGVMRFKAWRGLSPEYRAAVEGHTPWSPDDAEAKPVLVPDVLADPSLAELWPVITAEGIAALAFVPLVHHRRVVGKFMLYYDRPHDFSASEIAVAEVMAGQVALSLDRRRAEEAERSSARRLAGLQRVTAELSRAVTVSDVAAVALGTARTELGADSASLCLLAGGDLEIEAAVGYPADVMTHWRRFPLQADLPASEAVRTGQPVFLRSAAERDARYPVFASSPVVGDAAFAVVPLQDAAPIGCLVYGFTEPREFTAQDEAFLSALADQCAAAYSRARLYEDQERSRQTAAFLAEASAALASSLEVRELASRTADIAAGQLADWCAVFLREDGRVMPVALAHRDPAQAAVARDLLERHPISLGDRVGVGAVIRTGRPEIVEDVSEETLQAWGRNPDDAEFVRRLGIGAAATVPLTVRNRTIGALSVAVQASRLGPGSVEVARELAGRIAVAVDHARSYEQQARLSRTLQASLLPPSLPAIPGLELAACYAAGSTGVEVGGDFYDVFPLDASRFVVIVGDVCGRGIDAATTAALVRHTARSAALTDSSPAAIVAHLNDVLLRESDPGRYEPRFCTAVVAVVTHAGPAATVTLAVAGHPLPLLRLADGAVMPVGSPGMLVGVAPDADVSETRLWLRPGDALVCYTDGVTERRRSDTFFGLDGLIGALGATSGDASALAAAVERSVLDFAADPPGDDLAILVLRTKPGGPTRL